MLTSLKDYMSKSDANTRNQLEIPRSSVHDRAKKSTVSHALFNASRVEERVYLSTDDSDD